MKIRALARFGMAVVLSISLAGVSSAQQSPDELAQLKAQVQLLQQQLQALTKRLDDAAATKVSTAGDAKAPAATETTAATTNDAAVPAAPEMKPVERPLIASSTPTLAPPASNNARPAHSPDPFPQGTLPDSPLQFRVGETYITPIGFMDFTGVVRSKNNGGSIGTSFGSIAYGNIYQTNLSEFRLSMQNSRVGARFDAMVKGAHVMGYLEADFLGNLPANVLVSSNSNTLRSRVYWVDVSKGTWEVLGGQTWSLITPGRVGISPLPGNLFYSQDIDVNYQAGLVWGRIPEFRLVYHPSSKSAFAFAIDNPEQYVGGSSGGPVPTFPAALTTYPGGQLNNGTTTTGVPNVAPDFQVKAAFDPNPHAHIEFGGVERNFRVWNPNNSQHFSAQGGGVYVNSNFELAKGFRIIENAFWSDGGGRYIFGQVPDLIARADGSLALIHTGSTVVGFEETHGNTQLYGYYGGIYVQRNSAIDTNGKPVGYGYTGSAASNNRTIQEVTFGMTETFWKDPKYGALQLMFQYSYLQRNPWYVAIGMPASANVNMAFFNLRYLLPGAAPAMH